MLGPQGQQRSSAVLGLTGEGGAWRGGRGKDENGKNHPKMTDNSGRCTCPGAGAQRGKFPRGGKGAV